MHQKRKKKKSAEFWGFITTAMAQNMFGKIEMSIKMAMPLWKLFPISSAFAVLEKYPCF